MLARTKTHQLEVVPPGVTSGRMGAATAAEAEVAAVGEAEAEAATVEVEPAAVAAVDTSPASNP